jgi:hypothetical protein
MKRIFTQKIKKENTIITSIFIHINTPRLASLYATIPRLYISAANEGLMNDRRKQSRKEKQQTPHPSGSPGRCTHYKERKMHNNTLPNSVPPIVAPVTLLI